MPFHEIFGLIRSLYLKIDVKEGKRYGGVSKGSADRIGVAKES